MAEYKKIILVVDDDMDVRESLATVLEDEGYLLKQAANGKEASAIIKSESVDLLITDILMPVMDGIELVLGLKEIRPDLPFMLMSGGGRRLDNHDQYHYLHMGQKLAATKNILKKPFQPRQLIDMVTELIGDKNSKG